MPGQRGRPGSAPRRRLERPREQVLSEAMAEIAERGLAGLTMAGLARRLDTSGGHIMYYFRSKDQLLLETLRWSEEQLTGARRAALARDVPAAERLDAFVGLYLPRSPGDPRWMLWIEVWTRAAVDTAIRDAQAELDRAWRTDLAALLGEGRALGEFREVPADAYAARLLAMLDGFSVQLVLGVPGMTREAVLGHVAAHVTTTLLA
ncbi:MAG TPA: TetR/AcrR family transcriptional regulator [Thermomonospora sp.]|nr:TetR/AcrR family transcriptional regulator [Thermomonospora sp.]